MRPGQLTPENFGFIRVWNASGKRFNEAGAINPGKRCLLHTLFSGISSFNEAGAINPGKPAVPAMGLLTEAELQ